MGLEKQQQKGPSIDIASRKIVLAAYLAHWQNSSGYWRWDGWSWNGCGESHNPDNIKANGLRDIASIYYPLVGPYDDRDLAIQQYHMRLAKASGIDAFIVDWYGITEHGDFPRINSNFQRMLKLAENLDFGLAIEYDAYRFYLGSTGPGTAVIPNRADAIRQIHDDLRYVIQQFAASRVYLKFNGRPVIFVFGSEVLTPSEWAGIIESLQAEGHQAYFIRNYANFRYYPAFNSFFPWIGAHDIVLNHADPIAWLNQAAEELRAFSESHGIEWGLNVWPGFDSTPVADWCYGLGKIQIDRQGSLLYNKTWNAAIRNSPQWIEISTFNDWNEGTTVEPTIEYHYQYLYATAYYSAQFKQH